MRPAPTPHAATAERHPAMSIDRATAPHHAATAGAHGHTRRHGRLRSIANQLSPETIEQIARRVVQLLREPADHAQEHHEAPDIQEPTGLLTATQLAHKLGVNRSWVYQHAHTLGAITLGNGPKPRLRFDPQTTTTLLAANNNLTAGQPAPAPAPPARRGRPRKHTPSTTPLLPIQPRGFRSLFAAWPRHRFNRER